MKSFFVFIILALFFAVSFALSTVALAEAEAEKVDINIATLEQLDKLTGIGPTYAQKIIDARPYSSIDDLLKVSGIGEKTLGKIKEQGLAYVKNEATGSSATIENSEAVNNTTNEENLSTEAVGVSGEPVNAVLYPNGVFINEILPNPEGADETEEWIVSTIQQIALAYS